MEEKNEVRLQKFLADNGIASRRKCEGIILEGRVKVNEKTITTLGTKIDPYQDFVEVDGKILKRQDEKIYILLNKPIGYVTTVKDQFKRDTVMDLLKDIKTRIVPVGRLDMYTSGALILSNDGEFVNKVTHPSHEVEKTYNVTVRGKITKEDMQKLENGVDIGDYVTKPAKAKILKVDENKNISRFQIIIHEGKNRQIRRMCKAINKPVLALHRAAIGKISVKDKNNSNKSENEDIQSKENEKSKQVFNEKDEPKNTKHSLDLSEDKLKEDLVKILDVSIETIEID